MPRMPKGFAYKNRRRFELAQKKRRGGLTPAEKSEYQQAYDYVENVMAGGYSKNWMGRKLEAHFQEINGRRLDLIKKMFRGDSHLSAEEKLELSDADSQVEDLLSPLDAGFRKKMAKIEAELKDLRELL